jgi:hypothetical protein
MENGSKQGFIKSEKDENEKPAIGNMGTEKIAIRKMNKKRAWQTSLKGWFFKLNAAYDAVSVGNFRRVFS